MYFFAYFLIFKLFSLFIYLFFYFCILLLILVFILLFIPVFLEPYANGLSGFSNQTQSDQIHTCHNSYEEISVPDFHSHSTLASDRRVAHDRGPPPGTPWSSKDPRGPPGAAAKGLKKWPKSVPLFREIQDFDHADPLHGCWDRDKSDSASWWWPPATAAHIKIHYSG